MATRSRRKEGEDSQRRATLQPSLATVPIREEQYGRYLLMLRSGTTGERINAIRWIFDNVSRESGVPLLIEALHDRAPSVISEAAEALKYCQDFRAVPALTALLSHRDASVRLHCADAIGGIAWKRQPGNDWSRTMRRLEGLAANDPDIAVRLISIYSLEKICDARALDTLTRLESDPDSSIRYFARKAVEMIRALNRPPEDAAPRRGRRRNVSDTEYFRNAPF